MKPRYAKRTGICVEKSNLANLEEIVSIVEVRMTNAIPTIAQDALLAVMPDAVAKATSIDGQFESTLELWATEGRSLETGLWECTPGTFHARRDGYDEVAHVVSGAATVTGDDGVVVELVAGSIIVTPAGWTGTWVIHETMRKLYVLRTLAE